MTGYVNLPFRVVVKVYWCSSLLIFWVTTSSLWSSFRYISNLSLMHLQGFSFDAPLMAAIMVALASNYYIRHTY